MRFSFEFTANTGEDAQLIVGEKHAPDCVKDFLRLALRAFSGKMVYVKAVGHFYNYDYDKSSNVTLEVREVADIFPLTYEPVREDQP